MNEKHGTAFVYNRGCRCDECRAVHEVLVEYAEPVQEAKPIDKRRGGRQLGGQMPRDGKLVISTLVTLNVAERIEELAAERGESRSDEMRLALEEHVRRHAV